MGSLPKQVALLDKPGLSFSVYLGSGILRIVFLQNALSAVAEDGLQDKISSQALVSEEGGCDHVKATINWQDILSSSLSLFKIEEHTQLTKAFILASRGSSTKSLAPSKGWSGPLWSELDST